MTRKLYPKQKINVEDLACLKNQKYVYEEPQVARMNILKRLEELAWSLIETSEEWIFMKIYYICTS